MCRKKYKYVWQCCDCGTSNISFRNAVCPCCSPTVTLRKRGLAKKVSQGLPIVFELHNGSKEVMAGYDTGTHTNHMSLSLAQEMGHRVCSNLKYRVLFQLPNGNIIQAIGRTTAKVRFALGHSAGEMICHFNVFKTLTNPILFGMVFLDTTQTLSKHTSRLVDLPRTGKVPRHFCSVGAPTNQVPCMVDGKPIWANADTGSEIALISGRFVESNKLLRNDGCERLMLADGSVEHTSGSVDILLTLPEYVDSGRAPWQKIRFHILENLKIDLVLDEELVNDFDLFRGTSISLVKDTDGRTPNLAPIIHLGPIEKAVSKAMEKAKTRTRKLGFSRIGKGLIQPIKTDKPQRNTKRMDERKLKILQKIAVLDQEENRQREWASKQSFSPDQALAETQRQQRYENEREKLVREYNSPPEATGRPRNTDDQVTRVQVR